MKGLDTNVIVRFLVKDHGPQSDKALRFFTNAEKKKDRLLIPHVVILETIWVLESVYNCARAEILDALEKLTQIQVFEFEHIAVIQKFISTGRNSRIDLSDLFIGIICSHLKCEKTISFDKKAAKHSDYFQAL
ncbi:PIN domain-containing protein [Fibrobacterota bacterium]